MKEEIARLLELQQWDVETVRLESELNDMAPSRERLIQEVLDAKENVAKLKQEWMRAEVRRKGLEKQVATLQEQLGKYQAQQLQTKKNDEYRAFASQIRTTQEEISRRETDILDALDAEEAAKKIYEEERAKNKDSAKFQKERLLAMDALKEANTKALAERKVKRQDLAVKVPAALRIRYERMFRNKRGNVLVRIENGTCGGCHIALPQQVILSAMAGGSEVYCINCGRLLYCE